MEASERRQRLAQVVLDELHAAVVGEPLACRLEHDGGEVEAHAEHPGTIDPQEGEEPAVARSEVEDPAHVARHVLEQDAFSLAAARIVVRPPEIAPDVLGQLNGPKADGD